MQLTRQTDTLPPSSITNALYTGVWSDPLPLREIDPPLGISIGIDEWLVRRSDDRMSFVFF
jgi:hypothetical protein